jgi:hypothetical protein
MDTGSLSGTECFETAAAALDGFYSAKTPFSYTDSSGNIYTQSYVNDSGAWYQQLTEYSGGRTSLVNYVVAPVPAFVSCEPPSQFFFDGLAVGTAIVVVAAIAWGFHVLRRPLT